MSRNGVGAALRGIRSVPRGCALARRGAARVEGSADTSGSVTGTGGGIGTSHRWVVTANTPAGQVASAWHFEGVTAVTARDGSHGICVGRRRGRGVGAEMTRAHARGRPSQVRLPPAAWPAARFHNPRTSGDDGTSVATLSRWSGNNLARLVVGGSVTWATLVVMADLTGPAQTPVAAPPATHQTGWVMHAAAAVAANVNSCARHEGPSTGEALPFRRRPDIGTMRQ